MKKLFKKKMYISLDRRQSLITAWQPNGYKFIVILQLYNKIVSVYDFRSAKGIMFNFGTDEQVFIEKKKNSVFPKTIEIMI